MSKQSCSLINDNLYIKPVETCSASAYYIYKNRPPSTSRDSYFNPNTLYPSKDTEYNELNSNFRDSSTNNYIYKYNNNDKKDLCFPLKENDINSPYSINCVILTKNPFFTYNKEKKACAVLPDLQFTPNIFKYSDNKDYIYYDYKLKDPEGKFIYNKKNITGYCENSWYDWIIIPNYHFGNNYLKDSGEFSNEDVKVCYKPCNKEKLPYININGEHKCINKKIADNGLYAKKLDYSQISLINLIGNSEEDLRKLYVLMSLYEYDKLDKEGNYNNNIDRSIFNTNCTINMTNGVISDCLPDKTVYNSFKEVLNAYKQFSETIMENIIILDNFDIIKKYENYDNIITYKNINFEEKDTQTQQLTFLGLDNNNMLKDAILIHTFIISYNIYKFITEDIFKFSLSNNDPSKNIYTTYGKYNIDYILEVLLNKSDKYKNIQDNNKKEYIKHRLANILYKSINICYNNKSEFSKNIINRTKNAFNKFKSESHKQLLTQYYNFSDKITGNKTADSSVSKDTYSLIGIINKNYNLKTGLTDVIYKQKKDEIDNYINNLDLGIEIPFYKTTITVEQINTNSITSKFITDKTIGKDFADTAKQTILNYKYFFKEEQLENEVICKDNEIYDPNAKNCSSCDKYCDTQDKCNNDSRCKKYCKIKCPDITNGNNRIIAKTACGNIISRSNDINEIKENNNMYSETPLGENSLNFFSLFNNSVKSAMSIVFFLIILYIFYIIYEVFGESLLTLFNFIYYWLRFIFKSLLGIFELITSGFNFKLFLRNLEFDFAEYEKDTNTNRYERVTTKILTKSS